MVRLQHRDMTQDERQRVERAAHLERIAEPGWSSYTVAVAILLSGSFVAGILLFGVPGALIFPTRGPGDPWTTFGPRS